MTKKPTYEVLSLNCTMSCTTSHEVRHFCKPVVCTEHHPGPVQSQCQQTPIPKKNSEIYFFPKHCGGRGWWDTAASGCLTPGLFLFSKKCLWTEMVNQLCVSAISPVSPQRSSQPTQASSDLSPASAPALCSHPSQPSSFSILKLLGWFNPYPSHNYCPFNGVAGQRDSHWDVAALGPQAQCIPPLLSLCLFLLPLEILRISRDCC